MQVEPGLIETNVKKKVTVEYIKKSFQDPLPVYIGDGSIGVKTLNRCREDFLSDFADRMYHCAYFPNTYFAGIIINMCK